MKLDQFTFDKKYDIVHITYSDNTKASIAFFLDHNGTMHWYEHRGVCIEKVIKEIFEPKFKFKALSRHDNSTSFKDAQRFSQKFVKNKT
jgi:hypothetical protein